MSHVTHHAIVITTTTQENIDAALVEAKRLRLPTAGPVLSDINVYYTLLIGPDGSSEGRDISDRGDAQRTALIAWMRAQRHADLSSPYEWVEVAYGSDDYLYNGFPEEAAIIARHEWDDAPRESEE